MITRHRRPTWTGSLLGFVLLTLLGCAGLTDKVSTSEQVEGETLVVTYDIDDLAPWPAHYDWKDFPHGEPEPPDYQLEQPPSETATSDARALQAIAKEQATRDIVQLIRETVDPQSWKSNGGRLGTITWPNGNLIVRTTRKNHGEIAVLLDQLRQQRGIRIRFETRFLVVDQNFLDEIAADLDSFPGDGGVRIDGQHLNDIQVNFLIRATQSNRRAVSLGGATITTYNGQRAWVASNSGPTEYIAGYQVVKNKSGVHFQPKMSTVHAGGFVQVEGAMSADRRYVVATIEPKLTRLLRMDEKPYPDGPADRALTIQEPVLETIETQTTVSIPDGGTLMLNLGRTSIELPVQAPGPVPRKPRAGATEPTNVADERIVLFLIKPTILIPAEKEQELFPGTPTAPEAFPTAEPIGDADVRLKGLLRHAAELRRKLRYEEAMEVLDEAMAIDPRNVVTVAMKEMLQEAIKKRDARGLDRHRAVPAPPPPGAQGGVFPHMLVIYPPDSPWSNLLRPWLAGPSSHQPRPAARGE